MNACSDTIPSPFPNKMKTFSVVATIIALSAIVAALLVGWPGDPDSAPSGGPSQTYPWQIDLVRSSDQNESIRVFGLVLEQSRLEDAITRFGEEPELAIFRRDDGRLALEAYFGHLKLGMLLGKAVLALRAGQVELEQWQQRGNNPTISESGALKAAPSATDRPAIDALPIASLTFLPMVRLTPETIRQRFGEPDRRYQDAAGTEHWAWPNQGLDIALHQGRTKDVLQYLPPYRVEKDQEKNRQD